MKVLLGLMVAGMLSSPATAAVIYSTTFEAPTYVSGPLFGQDGWVTAGTVVVVEGVSSGFGTQSAAIVGDTSGLRALRPTLVNGAINPIVLIQGDLAILSDGPNTWSFAALSSTFSELGGFDIASDGTVSIRSSGLPPVGAVALDAFNTFTMVLDFSGNNYSLFLNGANVAVAVPFISPGTDLLTGLMATASSEGGIAYLDNYVVATADENVVPEPGTLAMIGAGIALVGLARLRRKQ
ncbi:MAG: PEP-CTERM sorting domain-containing protein [Bryobacteraceae bacterium]|nr:PEP-CTERM sorting domain-containing protein [Bryobacteraceae bacterium]